MQRLGRKGHPTYRLVVQDSRQAPTSGKVVARIGSYDPHTKSVTLVKDKAEHFLNNGAQPTDRVVSLFKKEGIKLPDWVKDPSQRKRDLRNPEKLRKNQPEAPAEESPAAESAPAEEPATEEVAETTESKAAEEETKEA
jgi:small subunit ribosomal protein S16